MTGRFLYLTLAACFSLTFLAAQPQHAVYVPENPVYVPFGAVHVMAHKNLNAPELPDAPVHPNALEHRFYHALSVSEYGTLLLIPESAEGRQGMEIKTAATPRGAMHRISFPRLWGEPAKTGEVLLDLSAGAAGRYGDLLWSHVRIEDEYTVTGAILSEGSQALGHTYFAVRFSRPVKYYRETSSGEGPAGGRSAANLAGSHGAEGPAGGHGAEGPVGSKTEVPVPGALPYPFMSGRGLSVVFTFDLVKGAQAFADDGVLEVRTAFSAVDVSGALQNLKAEQESKTFEALGWEMEQVWEKELAVVRIEGSEATGPAADRKNFFYESLARSMAWPVVAQDVDGRYRGCDNNIHTTDSHVHYTGLYPASAARYPLMTFLKPGQSRRFTASALTVYDQSVPRLLPGEAFRKEAVLLLADARAKGILPSSLLPLLTEAITTTVKTPFLSLVQEARTIGFVPAEASSSSVALTREFSYVNWCLIMMASGMGDVNTVNEIRPYVTAYQWLLDVQKGVEKDFPESRDDLLFVPHNMADVVDRAQGRKAYEHRLDAADRFPELPYLYVWTASPWKGQELLNEMADACVTASRAGELASSQTVTTGGAWAEQTAGSQMAGPVVAGGAGVADGEEPAAWFVFSSMGLYPLCPGTEEYVLGVPGFKRMVVFLEGGKELVVEAPDLSVRNRYVKSVTWNGKPYDKAFITHRELMQGGVLQFVMGASPARGRVFRGEKLPYSYVKK
jgi:putative alpha-1,2-mannosidase